MIAAQLPPQCNLKVSLYDRASALLVALVMLTGFFVAVMFMIWLTADRTRVTRTWDEFHYLGASPAVVEPMGRRVDLSEPGEEEWDELQEPELEASLASVVDVISSLESRLDTLFADASPAIRSGYAIGNEDGRRPGGTPGAKDSVGVNAVPRWDRWRIKYQTDSLYAYARQLDHFDIELGVAGGGRRLVDYAAQLSRPRPERRQGPGDEEKRLYFSWEQGRLKQFDRRLLTKAGVRSRGRVLLQFLPKPLENRLAALERAYADGADVSRIEQTVFGVRRVGSGYDFYVDSMRLRPDGNE